MKRMLILSSILVVAGLVQAQSVPELVNYQGRLTDAAGDPLGTGDYALRFEVYDDPVDTSPAARVWGPLCFDQATSVTPLPPGHKYKVPVVQGYFNVVLDQETGSGDCSTEDPPGGTSVTAAFAGTPRFMEIAVDNGSGWEPILPRQQVLSAPYAAQAEQAFHSGEAAHSHEVACDESSTTISVTNATPAEVDVLTVAVTGTETKGEATVNGKLTVDGEAEISGSLTAANVPAILAPTTYVALADSPTNHTVTTQMIEDTGGSFCFLTEFYLANTQDAVEFGRCKVYASGGYWWLVAQRYTAYTCTARCEARCVHWVAPSP